MSRRLLRRRALRARDKDGILLPSRWESNRMKMKIIGLIAPLLVCGSLSGQAATISSLGNLGAPGGAALLSDPLSNAGSFTNIYTFSVARPSDIFSVIWQFDNSIGPPQLFSGVPNGNFSPVAAN